MRLLVVKTRRATQILTAFFRLGWLEATSYPMAFLTAQAGQFATVFIFYFVADLVTSSPNLGGTYFEYVILGLLTTRILDAGAQGLGQQLNTEISGGRLEMLFVEPVRWTFIPFGLVQFQLMTRVLTTSVMIGFAVLLGARYRWTNVGQAAAAVAIGLAATIALALVGAAVRLLAKRSDPILTFYSLAVSLLSGVYYSPERLPDVVEPLAFVLPHTYAIMAVRKLLMRDGDQIDSLGAGTSALIMTGICIILFPIGIWTFNRALEAARRLGLLAGS